MFQGVGESGCMGFRNLFRAGRQGENLDQDNSGFLIPQMEGAVAAYRVDRVDLHIPHPYIQRIDVCVRHAAVLIREPDPLLALRIIHQASDDELRSVPRAKAELAEVGQG